MVGVGASAGGIEALIEFFEGVPAETGVAFVVTPHLSPEHKSALVDILAKKTSIPISEIAGDTPIEPDHVYVVSPNHYLSIRDGSLRLEAPPMGARLHLPIDHFLSSLAEEKKNLAIGVILSGAGSDGTRGLTAIKAEGGVTFAQRADTAKFPDMPRNAVASGGVDYVLSPREMGRKLLEIKPRLELFAVDADEWSRQASLKTILSVLKAKTEVDFTHYRRSTLNRRVNRRMILRNVEKIEDYAKLLGRDGVEAEKLFQDILISVTSFFRDPEVFEALKTKLLPRLLRDRDSTPLRVWVPACSTGEEAYSIAMCVLEHLRESPGGASLQIFATDVNQDIITKARSGLYSEDSVENVSRDRLTNFFNRSPTGGWQVSKGVRDLCVFSKHNVLTDPPFSDMDLISCRNLLIYFDETLQEKVIRLFHKALKPSGCLMLGRSESIGRFNNLFEVIDKNNRIFSRR